MNKALGIVLGLVLLLIPIYDWITNATGLSIGNAAMIILKGTITWILILVGLAILILNLSSLKSN